MIAAMKQISLSIDIDESTSEDFTKIKDDSHLQLPNFFNRFAFIFDPSTLIFGPFITYTQFLKMKYTLEQELRECNYYVEFAFEGTTFLLAFDHRNVFSSPFNVFCRY